MNRKTVSLLFVVLFPSLFIASPAPSDTLQEVAHLHIEGELLVQSDKADSPSFHVASLYLKPTFKSLRGNVFINTSCFHHPYLQIEAPNHHGHTCMFDSRDILPSQKEPHWEIFYNGRTHNFPLDKLLKWE